MAEVNAGDLRERIEVLELRETDGGFAWARNRFTWAKIELTGRRQAFSTYGVGAAGVKLTIRRQDISLAHAIRWRGQHCHIAGIASLGRQYLTVEAALVEVVACADRYRNVEFPAILAERYLRHQELEPQDINVLRHVLITPKVITLTPGRLVEVAGVSWPIRLAHTLGPWINEYEIERMVDL